MTRWQPVDHNQKRREVDRGRLTLSAYCRSQALAKGGVPQLHTLALNACSLGASSVAVADAFTTGGVPLLGKLYLADNDIGEPGGMAVAVALVAGGAPQLQALNTIVTILCTC